MHFPGKYGLKLNNLDENRGKISQKLFINKEKLKFHKGTLQKAEKNTTFNA